jgi:hypothetical protein
MNRTFRSALALLVGTAALTACDYRYSPGENLQFKTGFTNAPHWHSYDVNRDSINNRQRVEPASGEGSAKAIKQGSVKDKLNSAPSGDNAASPQAASGQMGSVDQTAPGKGQK